MLVALFDFYVDKIYGHLSTAPLQGHSTSKLTIMAQSNASWWKPLLASDLHRDNMVEGLADNNTQMVSKWPLNM